MNDLFNSLTEEPSKVTKSFTPSSFPKRVSSEEEKCTDPIIPSKPLKPAFGIGAVSARAFNILVLIHQLGYASAY